MIPDTEILLHPCSSAVVSDDALAQVTLFVTVRAIAGSDPMRWLKDFDRVYMPDMEGFVDSICENFARSYTAAAGGGVGPTSTRCGASTGNWNSAEAPRWELKIGCVLIQCVPTMTNNPHTTYE